jgi:alkylated DNA nucleotide flippase Atl1
VNPHKVSPEHRKTLQRLWRLVKKIPPGKVVYYGELARELSAPAVLVGKWMALAPDSVPWWRVVGKDGTLRIHKRSPALSAEQRKRLLSENVTFLPDGRVDRNRHHL